MSMEDPLNELDEPQTSEAFHHFDYAVIDRRLAAWESQCKASQQRLAGTLVVNGRRIPVKSAGPQAPAGPGRAAAAPR